MVLLQQLNAGGMTIILVTHENDVAAFASRVVSFRDGKVVSDARQAPRSAVAELERLQRDVEAAA
jgi:putative ABC transport system ATP-binding protein